MGSVLRRFLLVRSSSSVLATLRDSSTSTELLEWKKSKTGGEQVARQTDKQTETGAALGTETEEKYRGKPTNKQTNKQTHEKQINKHTPQTRAKEETRRPDAAEARAQRAVAQPLKLHALVLLAVRHLRRKKDPKRRKKKKERDKSQINNKKIPDDLNCVCVCVCVCVCKNVYNE